MSERKKILIFVGGKSAEHHISLCSGYNLLKAIDKTKFEPILIGITKTGNWTLQDIDQFLLQTPAADKINLLPSSKEILVSFGDVKNRFYLKDGLEPIANIAAIFPMLHGPYGEDGTIQGVFEHINLPYVGTNVLSSSVCMDKEIAKKLMVKDDIPTSKFLSFYDINACNFYDIKADLGLPCIVKPCNLGSSIGISKVETEADFKDAIRLAFKHDNRILIEEFIVGREIECAVLGNRNPIVSVPGEYVHQSNFFDFDAKYLKGNEIKMLIPAANLSEEKIKEVRELALKTYKTLACEGLSRVDIFITNQGDLFVNEVNTMPGFTNTSMYPSLINELGINYADLITKLIELAIERYEYKK